VAGAPAQPAAGMSPGSQRILQRKHVLVLSPSDVGASQAEGGTCPPPGSEARQQQHRHQPNSASSGAAAGPVPAGRRPLSAGSAVLLKLTQGLTGMLDLAGVAGGMPRAASTGAGSRGSYSSRAEGTAAFHSACNGAGGAQAGSEGASDGEGSKPPPQYLAHCTFRPAITERAAARPGRTPAELHAEGAARRDRMVSGPAVGWAIDCSVAKTPQALRAIPAVITTWSWHTR